MFVLMVKFLGIIFGTRSFGMLSGYTMTAMMLGSMAGSPLAERERWYDSGTRRVSFRGDQ
ncbi:MAG: hypothetical protein ACSW8A_02435 [Lachnospiraceae bacterium]